MEKIINIYQNKQTKEIKEFERPMGILGGEFELIGSRRLEFYPIKKLPETVIFYIVDEQHSTDYRAFRENANALQRSKELALKGVHSRIYRTILCGEGAFPFTKEELHSALMVNTSNHQDIIENVWNSLLYPKGNSSGS